MSRSRLLAAALAVLLALGACGCEARAGAGWSLAAPSGTKSRPSSSSDASGEEGDGEEDAEKDESSSARADGGAGILSGVDPEETAQALFDEGLVTLAIHCQKDFESPAQLDASALYWAVYKLYSADEDFKPDTSDYPGYEQAPRKQIDRLAGRWFGSGIPALTPQPDELGLAESGVLVNLDDDKGTYYFLESQPKDEKFSELREAAAEGGELLIRFNTEDSDGVYQKTYSIALRLADDGTFCIHSFSAGKKIAQKGSGESSESGGESSGE